MFNKNFSALALAAIVGSAGFAGAFSSFAITGPEVESKFNSTADSEFAKDAREVMESVGYNFDKLASEFVSGNQVNTDAIAKVPSETKTKIYNAFIAKGYQAVKDANEKLAGFSKNGKNYTIAEANSAIFEILAATVESSSSSGSGFVSVPSSSSTGGSSTGSSTSTSSSTQTTDKKADDVLTEKAVATAYVVKAENKDVAVDIGKTVEALLASNKDEAVTIRTQNTQWAIEASSVTDKEAIKNFTLKTEMDIRSSKATSQAEMLKDVPADVKNAANGKEAVRIDPVEESGKVLPFEARVKITVGADFAGKEYDVYYVVKDQSLKIATVKLNSQGEFVCKFKQIGDLVLVAK